MSSLAACNAKSFRYIPTRLIDVGWECLAFIYARPIPTLLSLTVYLKFQLFDLHVSRWLRITINNINAN